MRSMGWWERADESAFYSGIEVVRVNVVQKNLLIEDTTNIRYKCFRHGAE